MKRLRLVQVIVQPVFVLDDGESITPIEHGAVAIPAGEWPTYSGERFPREVAEWQQRIDEGAGMPLSSMPPPNRAQRRAKTSAARPPRRRKTT